MLAGLRKGADHQICIIPKQMAQNEAKKGGVGVARLQPVTFVLLI